MVKHEALHLLFKHLFRMDIAKQNPRLFNIAADLVVNQFVSPWPLPEGAVTLSLFPDMGLQADQTVEWYFERLQKLAMDMQEHRSQQGGGTSGEPGGQASGGALSDYSSMSAPKSASALDRLMGSEWHSDHQFWAHSEAGERELCLVLWWGPLCFVSEARARRR